MTKYILEVTPELRRNMLDDGLYHKGPFPLILDYLSQRGNHASMHCERERLEQHSIVEIETDKEIENSQILGRWGGISKVILPGTPAAKQVGYE